MGTRGSRENEEAVENLAVDIDNANPSSKALDSPHKPHSNSGNVRKLIAPFNSSSNAINYPQKLHSNSENVRKLITPINSQDMFTATLPRANCHKMEDDICGSDYNCKPGQKINKSSQNGTKTRRKLSLKNEKKVK